MTSRPSEPAPEADFRDLYARTYGDVLRFVQRRCHPTHAEDIAAEVYLVAWRRYADLPADHGERRAWLFGAARKILANARRSEDRRAALGVRLQDAHDGVAPGAHPDLVAARLDLARAWPRLSAEHQEALALAFWDELTSAQAGAVLGISATAYRIRLSRARRALRSLVGATDRMAAPAGRALPEGGER